MHEHKLLHLHIHIYIHIHIRWRKFSFDLFFTLFLVFVYQPWFRIFALYGRSPRSTESCLITLVNRRVGLKNLQHIQDFVILSFCFVCVEVNTLFVSEPSELRTHVTLQLRRRDATDIRANECNCRDDRRIILSFKHKTTKALRPPRAHRHAD